MGERGLTRQPRRPGAGTRGADTEVGRLAPLAGTTPDRAGANPQRAAREHRRVGEDHAGVAHAAGRGDRMLRAKVELLERLAAAGNRRWEGGVQAGRDGFAAR